VLTTLHLEGNDISDPEEQLVADAVQPNKDKVEALSRAEQQHDKDQAAKARATMEQAAAEKILANLGVFQLASDLGIDIPASSRVDGLAWCQAMGVESRADFKYLTQPEIEEFVKKIAPAILTVRRRKLAVSILATAELKGVRPNLSQN